MARKFATIEEQRAHRDTEYLQRRAEAAAIRAFLTPIAMPTKACAYCGSDFSLVTTWSRSVYCSVRCRTDAGHFKERGARPPRELTERSCAVCGDSFQTPASHHRLYCSRRCLGKATKTRYMARHGEEVRRRRREVANGRNREDPKVMLAGQLVRVSEFPAELQPIVEAIRETRRLMRIGRPRGGNA